MACFCIPPHFLSSEHRLKCPSAGRIYPTNCKAVISKATVLVIIIIRCGCSKYAGGEETMRLWLLNMVSLHRWLAASYPAHRTKHTSSVSGCTITEIIVPLCLVSRLQGSTDLPWSILNPQSLILEPQSLIFNP